MKTNHATLTDLGFLSVENIPSQPLNPTEITDNYLTDPLKKCLIKLNRKITKCLHKTANTITFTTDSEERHKKLQELREIYTVEKEMLSDSLQHFINSLQAAIKKIKNSMKNHRLPAHNHKPNFLRRARIQRLPLRRVPPVLGGDALVSYMSAWEDPQLSPTSRGWKLLSLLTPPGLLAVHNPIRK